MKFFGNANLQQNQLQNAVLETYTGSFPASPVKGQLAFVNNTVYICVSAATVNDPPIWVPLTREITAYTHNQTEASQTWTITHNLNTTAVTATIYDSTGYAFIPSEFRTNGNNGAVVQFNTAVAGRAVIVSGHLEGAQKPTYAYTHYQNSASTTWTINHNLGTSTPPIVRVFIGSDEVQPASISHPTTNQTVITFSTAKAGYARLI